jgi:hypothetical protein
MTRHVQAATPYILALPCGFVFEYNSSSEQALHIEGLVNSLKSKDANMKSFVCTLGL